MITVHAPELRREGERAILRAFIDGFDPANELWYSFPQEYGHELAAAGSDAFVLALLSDAMEARQDIAVAGSVSEKLFYSLTHYYMPILTTVRPGLQMIRILPEGLTVRPESQNAVVTGFSGGIDSFAVLADHCFADVPASYRLTHLLFHNVGSHGLGAAGRRAFEKRRHRLTAASEELGLPLITVDSNLHYLIGHRYMRTHPLRTVSVAHALQGLIGPYLFASSYPYAESHARPIADLAFTDPFAFHLLSTEATECILSGAQYTRTQKTARVADIELSHRYLDVCVHPEEAERLGRQNCSRCWKCARTMLTLELLGKLDLYSPVFDLDDWSRNRSRYIARVLRRSGPLLQDVIDLARRQKVSLPGSSRLVGTASRLARDEAKSEHGLRLRRVVRWRPW
jgi:hypothetical protein